MADTQNAAANQGHGLLCPTCRVDLVMSERQGIEIDYCPRCRGVWLDRGELDKIIERGAIEEARARPQSLPPQQSARPMPSQDRYDDDRGSHGWGHGGGHGSGHGGQGHGRGHGSFLGRLFD